MVVRSFINTARERLRSRPHAKKIATNIAWLVFDRFFRMGTGLLVGLWVARYLGPEQFGQFNYSVAFVAMFSALATLGLDSVVIRDLLRHPESKSEILGTTFLLKLLGGLSTLLVTFAGISLTRPDDAVSAQMVTLIGVGLIFQATDTVDFWYQSQVQAKYPVYCRNLAVISVAILQVWLILNHSSVVTFAGAKLAEAVFTGAFLLVAYQISDGPISLWRWSSQWAKTLLSDSWPLILSGLVIMLYMRIDQVMLGQMAGAESVGLYSAAVRISELWYFIPMAIVNSVYPALLTAREDSSNLYRIRLQQLFDLMAGLGILIALPMTFLSNSLVNWLFGEHFKAAGPILAIHIWTGPFVFLGVARGVWTTAEGFMKFSLGTTFAGAVINILLNLFVIPRWGGLGAALDTVLAQFVASVGAGLLFEKTRPIFYAQCESLTLAILWRKKAEEPTNE